MVSRRKSEMSNLSIALLIAIATIYFFIRGIPEDIAGTLHANMPKNRTNNNNDTTLDK